MPHAEPQVTPRSQTVLVVDDMPENIQYLGSLLQPYYRVLVAADGPSALKVASSLPYPDLILLDIMMPDMDGYEVFRHLQALPETAAIPVIFVTAMDAEADEARGLVMGAVDYITKPVVPALLLARVRTQLELKDARDWLKDRNAVLTEEVARQTAELRAAQAASEAASLSKSVFINTMSHELRTPMNGVIGMLQLAQLELERGSPAYEYLDTALASSLDMVDTLVSILEYAKIAHGEITLARQSFAIAPLFERLATDWGSCAGGKGLTFRLTQRPGTPLEMVADPRRVEQVLGILLDNACKFTRAGGIELGVEANASGIHCWVSDTGIGIAADKQESIFSPFEQADGSRTRQYGGIGLGLAIADRLVTLMGGALWVDSQVGQGSTFHVKLPQPEADSAT